MTMTDPIADMLTRVRNANSAFHEDVAMPSSKIKQGIAQILQDQGYVRSWRVEQSKSALRRLFSWGWRRLTRIGLGLDIADTQCGFKLFTRDAAHTLFNAGRIDGFSFAAELLFLAARFDLAVAEVPVEWFDAPGSKVQPGRVAIQFLRDLVKIRAAALLGRYPRNAGEVTDERLKVAIVTAVPPSQATLTEYGHHLVQQLAVKPEIDDVLVFAQDSESMPSGSGSGLSLKRDRCTTSAPSVRP